MLAVFKLDRTTQTLIEDGCPIAVADWIDIVEPTDAEREHVRELIPLRFGSDEDADEIESSARSYRDTHGTHISTLFLHRSEGRPENTNVNFVVGPDRLVTLHDRDVPALRLLRRRVRNQPSLLADPADLFVSLFEITVDHLGDTLQQVYVALDQVGQRVLEKNETDVEESLDQLARQEDLNGKVRLCLMDTRRDLLYVERNAGLDESHVRRVRNLIGDIDALLPHNTFLFEKVNFLMQAAQGFINIEQNQIIKIFSVAAVTFLPPTLIASIYGMNFHFMPELDWHFGYPLSLGLMVLSAVVPYLYFKRRGWL
jgi:magnesium transporter